MGTTIRLTRGCPGHQVCPRAPACGGGTRSLLSSGPEQRLRTAALSTSCVALPTWVAGYSAYCALQSYPFFSPSFPQLMCIYTKVTVALLPWFDHTLPAGSTACAVLWEAGRRVLRCTW